MPEVIIGTGEVKRVKTVTGFQWTGSNDQLRVKWQEVIHIDDDPIDDIVKTGEHVITADMESVPEGVTFIEYLETLL